MTDVFGGVLLIDKPKHWTSFDVVAKVRGILTRSGLTKPKVGHTGTLDPLATGLLVLLIGGYTKQAGAFTKLDKTYEVEMILGQTSSTGDEEGEKTKYNDSIPTLEEVQAAFSQFTGKISQVPPSYSARKINGTRAYKLAREGKIVTLKPSTVTVYSIELKEYEYPIVRFVSKVSSGTYIRSLVEDIGKVLGSGAYTKELHRTSVGLFHLKNALAVDDLKAEQMYDSLLKA